ncbi:MAG TPA: adenylosuccinate synthase [Anaerolineales bacterium]|nr:adenylosuccinate synthase [Anaerolineales bacterium]
MTLQIIVGAQWGDEGKGRIVDWFAAGSDYVARYNGGDNAGHSVTVGNNLFKLHLVPSGIIQKDAIAILGNGMVINPASLLAEMDMLRGQGIIVNPDRLRISYGAHVILPSHQALDKALDSARGKDNIGTTGKGIGPAYTDKAIRRGLRMIDLISPDLPAKLSSLTNQINVQLIQLQAEPLNPDLVISKFLEYQSILSPYIADTSLELSKAFNDGKTILAEGAQGTLLDIDHGTYPFVTSSNVTAMGVFPGLGLGLNTAQNAIVTGVCKSFQTRVGSGPFPTEVLGAEAERLRGTGANPWDEFGTTTGRARRVGWLDGVLLNYSARINGLTELIITKMDILTGLERINYCSAYKKGAKQSTDLVNGPSDLNGYEPIYEQLAGWEQDLSSIRKWNDVPKAAKEYIRAISDHTRLPVKMVCVGPEREQVVFVN